MPFAEATTHHPHPYLPLRRGVVFMPLKDGTDSFMLVLRTDN